MVSLRMYIRPSTGPSKEELEAWRVVIDALYEDPQRECQCPNCGRGPLKVVVAPSSRGGRGMHIGCDHCGAARRVN